MTNQESEETNMSDFYEYTFKPVPDEDEVNASSQNKAVPDSETNTVPEAFSKPQSFMQYEADEISRDTVDTVSYNEPVLNSETNASGNAKAPAEKKRSGSKIAAAVAGLMILSAACGFGGSYFGNTVWQESLGGTQKAEESTNQPQVVMETTSRTGVIKTAVKIGEKMTVAQTAEAIKDTVVEITTETVTTNGRIGQYVSSGAGSGVIISAGGYIVTNNHVIDGASKITVRMTDGQSYEAKVVGKDAQTDLAVLKIEKSNLPVAVFGKSSDLVVGEDVIAIGNPLGQLGGTVTEGIISALGREVTVENETMTLLQISTAINPGNSGGGLFNLYGELVGIVNAKSSGSGIEGLGFAIPADTAKTVTEQLIEYGYVRGRVDLGITVIDISDAQMAMMYRVRQTGVYILKSDNNKLVSGDIVKKIDGKAIENQADYNSAVSGKEIGDKMEIVVSRDGDNITEIIVLTEQKS